MCKTVARALLLTMIITAFMVVASGCSVGIKEKHTLVMVSPVPIPDAARGVVIIGTDDLIPLAILDQPTAKFKRSIAGYVVVDPWFYDKLIKQWNER